MDWVGRMEQSIGFIEDNIESELNIDEIARAAHASRYHFHRMFLSMVGVTPADYLRRRRLTLAARDLVSSNSRVIDIAARYGYGSPNAFTRAFREMHGVNPSEARANQTRLSAFARVSLSSSERDDHMLDYRIIEKPDFTVLGKSKDFSFDRFIKEGPKFWKNYVGSEDYRSLIAIGQGRGGAVSEASLLSVYFPLEDSDRETFVDVLGIEVSENTDSSKYSSHPVPAATYAEFTCKYQSSMKTNKQIYGEWFAATGYERDGSKPDIAAYFPLAFRPMNETIVRWWIPVVRHGA